MSDSANILFLQGKLDTGLCHDAELVHKMSYTRYFKGRSFRGITIFNPLRKSYVRETFNCLSVKFKIWLSTKVYVRKAATKFPNINHHIVNIL